MDELGNLVHPLDAQFHSLGLSTMDPVMKGSGEFSALEEYVRNTHGDSHRHFKVDVHHAFRVERYLEWTCFRRLCDWYAGIRQSESEAWNNAKLDGLGDGERLLLWHGSRTTNFAGSTIIACLLPWFSKDNTGFYLGILKQGLRIAPPEGA